MKLIVNDVVRITDQNTLVSGAKTDEFNQSILQKINENKECVIYKDANKIRLNIIDISPSFSIVGDVLIGIKFSNEIEKEQLIGGEIRIK